MTVRMSTPWKHPKTHVYYLRRAVPRDLVPLVGKREVKVSLNTKDPRLAKELFSQKLYELDVAWRNLKRGTITLTEAEADEMAKEIAEGFFRRYADEPSSAPWDLFVGNYLQHTPADLQRQFQGVDAANDGLPRFVVIDRARSDLLDRCAAEIRDFLYARGLSLGAASLAKLQKAVGRHLQSSAELLKRRANGDFTVVPTSQAKIASQPAASSSSPVSFGSVLAGWRRERGSNPKTSYTFGRTFRQLQAFVGHDDLTKIARGDIIRWKVSLIAKGLQAKTITDGKLAPVRSILQWAVDNDLLNANPALNIRVENTGLREPPEGYNDDQATLILTRAKHEHDPLLRWVPLLQAYSGARVSEICQLRKEDVIVADGVDCLNFSPKAGTLKNKHSIRKVPLHDAILNSGFLAFVQQHPGGPLFGHVPPDRFGRIGGTATKRISLWIRNEICIKQSSIAPNHAWRHRFKTLTRDYQLNPAAADAIAGHAPRTVGESYGEFRVTTLKRELDKIPELTKST